jgi:hypothetical protein
LSLLSLGYVDEIQDVLLGNTEKELKVTFDHYNKKVPKPLTSQFPDRRPKAEAVNTQKKRKSMETTMYPPCKHINIDVLCLILYSPLQTCTDKICPSLIYKVHLILLLVIEQEKQQESLKIAANSSPQQQKNRAAPHCRK